jgi:hypothetical protein
MHEHEWGKEGMHGGWGHGKIYLEMIMLWENLSQEQQKVLTLRSFDLKIKKKEMKISMLRDKIRMMEEKLDIMKSARDTLNGGR